MFSEEEPTALVQKEGGPCAVIAPIQAFLLKNILFLDSHKKGDWKKITGNNQADSFISLSNNRFTGNMTVFIHLWLPVELINYISL